MQLSFLILLLAAAVGGAEEQRGHDDCGVFGWTVPPPPKGAKLMQVHAIIRHGDRTPWTGDLCWPNDSSVWNCTLSHAEVPMYADDMYGKIVPRVYRKRFLFGDETLNGNCSIGQLTTIGYNQQLANGKALMQAYVKSGFLDDTISSSEIYIRSDNEPRTQQSAESLMLGMYPLRGGFTEVVELETRDTTFDYITCNSKLCPKFAEYQEEFKHSKTWLDHWNQTEAVLTAISNAINYTVDEDDLDPFSDCLRTHLCHGLPWPKGMTSDLYERAWGELSWQEYNMFKYPSVQANAQVGIGFLLKEILQQINASVSGKPVQKFLLYSGHDTTLIPILVALQVDNGVWPPYASMILLELYDVGGKYMVRVIYNGKVLQLPFCGSRTLCDFETFSNYMSTVTPSDPAKQCLQKQKWKWYYNQ